MKKTIKKLYKSKKHRKTIKSKKSIRKYRKYRNSLGGFFSLPILCSNTNENTDCNIENLNQIRNNRKALRKKYIKCCSANCFGKKRDTPYCRKVDMLLYNKYRDSSIKKIQDESILQPLETNLNEIDKNKNNINIVQGDNEIHKKF
jgi:hypothetical protein